MTRGGTERNSDAHGCNCAEGDVDLSGEHIDLRHGNAHDGYDQWLRVALIGPPVGRTFPVRWLLDPTQHREVEPDVCRELDFYLVEHPRHATPPADAWQYAIYHCGTQANVYSPVHWSYFPIRETTFETRTSRTAHTSSQDVDLR